MPPTRLKSGWRLSRIRGKISSLCYSQKVAFSSLVPSISGDWVVEKAGSATLMAEDGPHYSNEGYARLAEAVGDCILKGSPAGRSRPWFRTATFRIRWDAELHFVHPWKFASLLDLRAHAGDRITPVAVAGGSAYSAHREHIGRSRGKSRDRYRS